MANPAHRAVPAHLAEHEDDDDAEQRGYVKGTDYALPYFSQWSRLHEGEVDDGLLRHVNCGYLSTHGVPPTLLTLKQHAQALCILIHALNPTLKSGEIAGGDPRARAGEDDDDDDDDASAFRYQLNDAFDFLDDLTVPYTNDDPDHHKPLMALVNEVRGWHEAHGTTYHCPLAETRPRGKGEKQRPYASHHSLVMHANACLERLDHEFSSTGGLLSLLPIPSSSGEEEENDPANADLANARNSLLGQWLLFTQHLVSRMHDLERSYGNALDALAGEAAIPQQHLSRLGPDARTSTTWRGANIAYHPQDRWILVNAGDDVFDYVHQILDRQEALIQAKEKIWRRNGVAGEYIWTHERGGRDYARGIVPVNIVTRYYRLAGRGRNSPLFVLPAWEHHPGVQHTREAEAQPTVVACAQPKFPGRATELEKRFMERINRAQRTEMESLHVMAEVQEVREQVGLLRRENEMLVKTRDALMLAVGEGERGLAEQVHKQKERAGKAEREVREARRERDRAVKRERELKEELQALHMEVRLMRQREREKAKGRDAGVV
ncbi:uncharacterized protein B0T15DRAFT_179804 [Chaetomium strumarium]|uniref:Uncharacterized protein n=1 Tax=Chaetomium strumarium TaxID=1170767 RepID=A0AAJ0GWK6_9PEZI|nr:hypothetical protein B0T15DRAFT_179804 [Chaetomium strumarium]